MMNRWHTVIGATIAVMVIACASTYGEQVTDHDDRVDREGAVDPHDQMGADGADEAAGLMVKFFHPPDDWLFDVFKEEKKNQVAQNRIDLVPGNGWTMIVPVPESPAEIRAGVSTQQWDTADQWPIEADGNLAPEGGQGEEPVPPPERHWAAQVRNVAVNINAFRPQHEHPTDNYHPFERTQVPEEDEEDPDLGPGIRINGDDDDGNSAADRSQNNVPDENDLIELVLTTDASGTASPYDLFLVRDAQNLEIWEQRTKGGAANKLTFNLDGGIRHKLDLSKFTNGELTLWAEWAGANHATPTLPLEAKQQATPHNVLGSDVLQFHTFRSIVIILGGEDQAPTVPRDISQNTQGIFVLGDHFYETGYDAHSYDEDNVFNDLGNPRGSGPVFDEVEDAVASREVENIAILGYSHGGGSTFDLAWRIDDQEVGNIVFTSYIDAIENDTRIDQDPEILRPPGSNFHVNDWQPNPTPVAGGLGEVNGAPTTNADENREWPNEDHGTIDNEQTVHSTIIGDFENQNMTR